jgi:beta-lactamase regulating signal transducer with metallopeptidase domain
MEELFLELLNRGLAASWLVLAAVVLRFALRRAPKRMRGVLWALLAVRLVCPYSVESALSLIPSAEPVPREILYEAHPRLHTGIAVLNTAAAPAMESAFAPQPGASVNPLQVYASIGARLWLAGACVMLGYALWSYLRLRARVAVSIPLRDNIRLCDGIDSPFILGVLRPRVYVPSGLTEPQLSHVLAHERAHLARRDHWWKPLGFALLAVYWFHPALWLAYVLLCRDIELACDERVYRDMALSERADYSRTLLEQSCSRARVAACPLAFGETDVRERVKAALSYKKPAFWVLAAAAVACVVLAVCFLTNPRQKPAAPEPATATDAPVSALDEFRRAVDGAQSVSYTPPAVSSTVYPDAITDPALLAEVKSVLLQIGETAEAPAALDEASYLFEGGFYLDGAYERLFFPCDGFLCVRDGAQDGAAGATVLGKLPEGVDLNWVMQSAARRQATRAQAAENSVEVLIVQFDPQVLGREELDALGEKYGFEAVRNFGRADLFSAYFDEPLTREKADGLLAALNAEDGIVLAGTFKPNVSELMGFADYRVETEELVPNHYLYRYIAELDGGTVQLAESFGFKRDDHIVDLDGDGVAELVCNCVFGGDGVRRVYVYRRNGDVIERGSIDYDRLNLAAWNNWGANSTSEWYDTMTGKLEVEYASLASSSISHTFTREAGCDALIWEEYTKLP